MDLFENYYIRLAEDLENYIFHLETAEGFKFARSIRAESEEEAKTIVSKEYPNATIINITEPSLGTDSEVKRYDYQTLED